jgi:hypothetical protein
VVVVEGAVVVVEAVSPATMLTMESPGAGAGAVAGAVVGGGAVVEVAGVVAGARVRVGKRTAAAGTKAATAKLEPKLNGRINRVRSAMP